MRSRGARPSTASTGRAPAPLIVPGSPDVGAACGKKVGPFAIFSAAAVGIGSPFAIVSLLPLSPRSTMLTSSSRKQTHRCPICHHEVELTIAGHFMSHGVDGRVRRHAKRKSQSPFCRGSVMRVRGDLVFDADNRPVVET